MALADIYQKATLVQIPSGYKSGTLYSVVPNTAVGDFTVTGDAEGEATRVNKDGLIETVVANVPRLDYNPSNPQDATLLLEPQRTNDTTHSEDFTQTSYWNNVIDVVATTNQTTAPDGSNTGDKIQANSGTNFKILRKGAFTIPSGITMSMFVKRGNHDYITFKAQEDYSFNLSTLEWRFNYPNVGYELYPNGWIRLYATTTSSSLNYFGIYLLDSGYNQSWDATGNEFVYVWGAQYETGTYPSSYIPTSGSAVTRTADTCEKSSVASGILGQTEGVIFLDFENYGQVGTSYGNHFKIESAGNNDRVAIQSDAVALNRLIFVINDGSSTFFQPREDISLGRNKIAIKYKSGDIDVFLNGTKVETSSSTFTFTNTLNKIYIGQPNKVHQAMIFNEALSDAEIITLTS